MRILYSNLLMVDYYKILGISRDSNNNSIKRAYHKMARKFHPDKNPDKKAENTERFKQIKEAYEVLSDEKRRKIYDNYGIDGLKRMEMGQNPRGSSGNPFDMFSQMFRGGPFGGFPHMNMNMNHRKRKPRGSNINYVHYYTLEDLYNKAKIIINYEREKICENCKGLGVNDSRYIKVCEMCNGNGMINRVIQLGPGMIQQSMSICQKCNGDGKCIEPGHGCHVCGGLKKRMMKETVRLDPPGKLLNGTRAVMTGYGNEEPDGISGDLEIQFIEKSHSYIKRCVNHLLYVHDVKLEDALLGFEFNFKHLDGRILQINEKGPLCPDSHYIIPGEGLNGQDLYIKYNIKFPDTLTDSQRSILESIFPRSKLDDKSGIPINTVRMKQIPDEVRDASK